MHNYAQCDSTSICSESGTPCSSFCGDLCATPTLHNSNRKLLFLTSGGDSQGMNAAIKTIVRVAIHNNAQVFASIEGYTGLVKGGEYIKEMQWQDVAHIINLGGTITRSARCKEFFFQAGRLEACRNLVMRDIHTLIVIGGDGSLTGANILYKEWPELLDILVESGQIGREAAERNNRLVVIGMAGSIDNDMIGTDVTIGANSSLHRIIESVDCISTTALSHNRAFVVEVMGRKCGWLALMASIAAGADYMMIPEQPPPIDWQQDLCKTITTKRGMGKQAAIVIVSEGAIDRQGNAISGESVRVVLQDFLGMDSKLTTLGHVQRGGSPSSFDRYLAILQAVHAVRLAICEHDQIGEPILIGMRRNRVCTLPLEECVLRTKEISKMLQEYRFRQIFESRDEDFQNLFSIFSTTSQISFQSKPLPCQNGVKNGPDNRSVVAVLHNGAPACGMNPATRVLVQNGLARGFRMVAVYGGFKGLLHGIGSVCELTWLDVDSWCGKGGSMLGTNRMLASDFSLEELASSFRLHKISALVIVGGFEAFQSTLFLNKASKKEPALAIPIVCLPVTISNNVPGTEISCGSDTALNVIAESCDHLKQSAASSHNRLFVLEVQGGNCGYLATIGCLSGGATTSYIPEEGVSLSDLQRDIRHLLNRYSDDSKQGRILIRNENCSKTYTTEIMSSIFEEEANGKFDCRSCNLGHLQQGGTPTPFDRIFATNLAVEALNFIQKSFETKPSSFSAVLVGVQSSTVASRPIADLESEADWRNRRPLKQWWLSLRPLIKVLSSRIRCPLQPAAKTPPRKQPPLPNTLTLIMGNAEEAKDSPKPAASPRSPNACVEVLNKRIKGLRLRLEKLESYEKASTKQALNQDQIDAISKKSQVKLLLEELEKISQSSSSHPAAAAEPSDKDANLLQVLKIFQWLCRIEVNSELSAEESAAAQLVRDRILGSGSLCERTRAVSGEALQSLRSLLGGRPEIIRQTGVSFSQLYCRVEEFYRAREAPPERRADEKPGAAKAPSAAVLAVNQPGRGQSPSEPQRGSFSRSRLSASSVKDFALFKAASVK